MTAARCSQLAENYHVTDMSRSQFGQLLKELRDSGAITWQEFSAVYSGEKN